jgi:6-phosphogluconolactonase (cycloisomerase 2 family)
MTASLRALAPFVCSTVALVLGGFFAPTADAQDTTPPRISSIERQTPVSSPTNADSLTWRLTFNEDVNYTPARAATGFTLTNTATIPDAGSLELNGVRDVTTAVVNGTTYLFAAGEFDDGISVFSVASNGILTNVDNVTDSGVLELDGVRTLTTAIVNGTTYLFAGGDLDGVSVFSVANDGALTNTFNIADDATNELDGTDDLATAVVNGTTYLFVGQEDYVTVFSVANDGALTSVFEQRTNTGADSGLGGMAIATVNGTTYLVVGLDREDQIRVYSVANDGSLTQAFTTDPFVSIRGQDVATAQINGTSYLFVAGGNEDFVLVYTIADTGALTEVTSYVDSTNVALRGAHSITSSLIDGTTYLFVAGLNGDGVSVFSFANDTLTNVANVIDDDTLGLDAPWSVSTAMVSGMPLLFVASDGFAIDDSTLSAFSLATAQPEVVNFAIAGTTAAFTETQNSASEIDVTATGGDLPDLNGLVTLSLAPGQTFRDTSGNALVNTAPTDSNDDTFLIDNTAPRIASIGRQNPASSPTGADSVAWRVTFDEVIPPQTPFSLNNVQNIADTAGLNLNGARAAVTAVLNGTNYLFVAATADDGISVFSVGTDGTLTFVDNVNDDATLELEDVSTLAMAEVNGTTYLFAGGFDDGVSVFSVANDGTLANVDNVADDATLPLDAVLSLTTATVGGNTYLFTTGFNDDAVGVFAIAGDGTLSNVFNVADDAALLLDGARALTAADVNGTTYLFVAGGRDNGISSFSVASDGTLTNVENIVDTATLELDNATTLTTAVVNGTTYLFVGGFDDDGVSVFSVANDGTVTNVDNVADDSSLLLDGTSSLTTSVVEGTTFLFVTGLADDGVSTFIVANDGSLTNVGNQVDDVSTFLNGHYSTVTIAVGGTTYLYAMGDFEDGISVFAVIKGTFASPNFTLTGTTAALAQNILSPTEVDLVASGGDLVNLNGTVTLGVSPGHPFVDVAGNPLTDTAPVGANDNTFEMVNDVIAPRVTSIVRLNPGVNLTDADTVTWRVLFSETVTNIGDADFQITGTTGTIGTSGFTGSQIDVTVSGGDMADLNGTVSISFAPGQDIADTNGNALTDLVPTGVNENTFDLDNAAPSLVISGPAGPVSGIFTATFTFDEDVTGFDVGDITIVNGAASNFQTTSASVYAATITPSADGVVTIDVAAAVATDAIGNDNTATIQFSVSNDETPPELVITGPSEAVSGPFTVTFTFSEPVTGFAIGDILVGSGSASDFSATSTIIYTALITPDSSGSIGIVVPANSATDAAGNGNVTPTPLAIGYDPDRTLIVILPGVGSGRVASSPSGIDCGADCIEDYTQGSEVTLTATADSGSSFAGWTTGPCVGTSTDTCVVTMSTDTIASARFTLDAPPAGRIVAASLPGARSGYVGGPVITALMSVVSRTSSPAQSCQVAAPAGAPIGLNYRQLDGSGAPVGPENPLFDIDAGGSLDFVIAMSADRQTSTGGYEFMPVIACQNASLDPIVGISSVLLTIDDTPTPDILSISATPSNDGVIRIPTAGGVGFMTAAATNIGVGDGSASANEITMTTTVDTGSASLPVNVEICQIDQATAACLTPRGPSVTLVVAQNTPVFFAVFVRDTSTGGIAFNPANSRVFLRFADASGTIRSATSAAVTAPAPANAPEIASSLPQGRWSVLIRQPDGVWPSLARAAIHVIADGRVLVDDGIAPRLTTITAMAPVDDGNGTHGFFASQGLTGLWTSSGQIRLGGAWAEQTGEFWGVRDTRSDAPTGWQDLVGTFGNSLILSETGEIRGSIGGCAVYGRASARATRTINLSLTGCGESGGYLGLFELPANENGAPTLLIANRTNGWRVER